MLLSRNITTAITLIIAIVLHDFLVFYHKKGILGFDFSRLNRADTQLNRLINYFRIYEVVIAGTAIALSLLLNFLINVTFSLVFYTLVTCLTLLYLDIKTTEYLKRRFPEAGEIKPETRMSYIFENRFYEYFSIIFILLSIGNVTYNMNSTPSITPLRWTLKGEVITVTSSRGIFYSLLIGWGILSYFLTVLLSYDVSYIITITKEDEWGRKFIKNMATNRLIQTLWVTIWLSVWISSAIYSYNPIYPFCTISLITIVALLIIFRRCQINIIEGKSIGLAKSLKTVFSILRFRMFLVFIMQILMIISFTGSLIKI
ncbi:MAG: hypothetical protein H0Z29_07845 [Candidatus Marinimicrobia bacterium]|nr:hypothetical protein [Candidatus Neomarinimicrobiota bacterium]